MPESGKNVHVHIFWQESRVGDVNAVSGYVSVCCE